MVKRVLVDIEQSVRELCAERDIPVDSLRFFGSRAQGVAQAQSDVDMVLVSPAFEGKDIFQRAEMTKGMHRMLVRRFEMPFDIVLCSVSEWLHGSSPLLREIQRVA